MSGRGWPWDVLEMEPPGADVRAVKRAYARQLKAMDPGSDIAGFEALRRAYEAALSRAEAAEAKAARQAARGSGGQDGEGGSAGQAAEPASPEGAPMAPPLPMVTPPTRRALTEEGGGDRLGEAPAEAPPLDPQLSSPPGPTLAPHPGQSLSPRRGVRGQGAPRPAPDPEARARAARQRQALGLFQERAGLGLRSQAIAGLTEDADLAGAAARDGVRRALVGLLRDHLQPPFQGASPHFGGAITRADLARIDARLGWMADHRAMRSDLGGDPVLTEAVVDLLVGRKVIEGDLARSRGWAWRVWQGLRTGSRLWTWAGLFLGFKLLQWKANTLPEWAIWSLVTVSALVLTAVFLPAPVGRPLGRALRWALAPLRRWWAGVPYEIRRLLAMGLFIAGGMALLIWSQLG